MQPDWPLGTHLTTPRRGYVHHGIYAGDGRVIHYAGYHRPFRRGPVLETTLEQFTRGHGVRAEAAAAAHFAGADAVERARTRLGEDRYRVWTNNCEHFVHWCLSGSPRSMQVERWARPLRPLRAAVAALRAPQRTAALQAA
ncbi:MAG TPA: lecithin retinol acyltransferase family protein [Burkholderiaceae bacterium]|nr:lecithin retinol acyltransferase family protein [Burkholderiaceae bacterium]